MNYNTNSTKAANENSSVSSGVQEEVMSDAKDDPREVRREPETNGNGDARPPPPTWSVANAKDVKPPPETEPSIAEPKSPRPEVQRESEATNGNVPGDGDNNSDIDEILAGGDAEPEPPRYDGDFDQERHDYWWNLLDPENSRHARASKGMRYGAERNPRCETCERQNRACMTRPNSHDRTGCVRCSYTQSGCSHAREARESHVCHLCHVQGALMLIIFQQQKTGWPKPLIGGSRKRDDMEDDGSFSPPPVDSIAKRPRLSSYGIPAPGEGRGTLATPSRSGYDAAPVNGRHYSPHAAPGSGSERNILNGDSRRESQYYEPRPESYRREERSYHDHDRCELRIRESDRQVRDLLEVVGKLQREVRVLRSRMDGMERRVNDISGAIDI